MAGTLMVKFSWAGSPFDTSYRKAIARILIPTFFAGMASLGVFTSLMSLMVNDLLLNIGYSTAQAEGFALILVGVDLLAKLAISPLAGYLADKVGRRKVVVLGISYGIIAALSFLWAYLFTAEIAIISAIIAGIIALGFEKGQFNTAITVASGDTGEEYQKIGPSEAAWDVALIGGMIVGVIIVFLFELDFIQAIIFGLTAFSIGTLLSFLVFKETNQPITYTPEQEKRITIRSYRDIFKERNFIPLFAYAFTVEAEESGFVFAVIPLMLKSLGFEAFEAQAMAVLPAALVLAIVFIPIGRLSDKYGRRKTSLFGCAVSIPLFCLIFFFRDFVSLIIIGSLLAAFVAFYRIPLMASITDMTDRAHRGVPYGVFRGIREIGGSFAPMFFGVLILAGLDLYDLVFIMAGITAIALVIAFFTFKETARTIE